MTFVKNLLIFFSLSITFPIFSNVRVGLDVFFDEGYVKKIHGKNIAIITNHTGVDGLLKTTIEKFKDNQDKYKIIALFSPEHGIKGSAYAFESVDDSIDKNKIPIYSLHGKTRRPTDKMLTNIDVLIYDIQCIGSRSYTYITTLFYVMEEASKKNIKVIILDRPNPLGGVIVDGPLLDENLRSFIGYINVPYCHGMTIGELGRYFNEEYKIGCDLEVISMKGWKREMSFADTKLHWVPPSPHIPEPDTPFFYPSTGILGELQLLSIGIGYTLPFKIIGAPWIDSEKLASMLNMQKLPGVYFMPFSFKPFYGMYKGKDCHGVKIQITDPKKYRPIAVQFLILGILKSLYPKKFAKSFEGLNKKLFSKAVGSAKILEILEKEKYAAWKMIEYQAKEIEDFKKKRKKYLIEDYN
ncbi:MAG: DUF1343 domain-containing protein [Chlamydiota bacterium]|jgi:uncharacterized protein YbbC (DUF1343 family)